MPGSKENNKHTDAKKVFQGERKVLSCEVNTSVVK